MKALVLSGGAGTRLRPITHTSAKQLVPVANKPVLFYGLESIRDAGITDVGVIVGDTAAEIEAALGDGSELGIKVTYIPQEAPLGLAHCVLIAQDFLGDDDFIMYLGDNFLIGGITEFVQEFQSGADRCADPADSGRQPSQFGIAVLDEAGHVAKLVEKPKDPPSDLALVGVYMFTPAIHEAVRSIKPSWRNELEITDAIQWLIENGKAVRSHLVTGYWKDTGRLEDMLECNRKVLEGLETDIRGSVDDEQPAHRPRGRRGGCGHHALDGPWPGDHRPGHQDHRHLRRAVHVDLLRLHARADRDRALDRARAEHDPGRHAASRTASSASRSRSRRPIEQPRAHRLMLGDHSKVSLS